MAKRTIQRDPELLAHQQWLGYLQPVGLVVAPVAMQEAGWVVTRSGSELIERQERYRDGLEPLGGDDDDADERELGFTGIKTLLVEQLGWGTDQVQSDPKLIEGYTKELPELGETLQPTAVVPVASGEGAQLLVQELPLLMPLDQKLTAGEHLWKASPHERFERLLRETGVEAGLLFNGAQLRLVVAPKGESSGYLTFPLADLAEVSGRLMFSGLDLLLGQSHVFLDPDGYRLRDVLKKSRSFQAVVSNALADQVLAALWDLLRGFQHADELSQRQDIELLGDLPERDAQQLYGGLITMLMRLVFLLYAEDEALMPSDAVYEQNYKLSGIYEQLQQDESEYPDTMEQRFGAWAGLMSLCRLVFDGGGPTADYLPARHGQLFDPAVYPWLESPWISDGVVLAVLRNLLIVNGERISYRALDVEQIGSVYEGIMGYAVRRIPGRCIGLKSKPQGAKKQLTTAVDLDALLTLPGGKRKAWLEEEAGTTLPAKSASGLKDASSEAELLEALAPRINRELFDGPQVAGGLVFQPTEERRRSGSHYTPRSLTRPIVEEALRPWLERCEHRPTAAQILDLKICDPAMGSGAFLVESCRYLAELLELAWNREGLPDALKPGGHAHGEEPLIYARRLIAQSCLYGVDKNPFAVNLARLSLWLVSLSKDAPFTFVDHALKCGDSLVGMERAEIEKALKGASLQRDLQIAYLDQLRQQEARSSSLFRADSRSDADDDKKRQALEDLNASTAYLRTVGDLLVAAFFNGKTPRDRDELKQLYVDATLQHNTAEALKAELQEPLEKLRNINHIQDALHWDISFPEAFSRPNPGFDAVIGNPPYLGGARMFAVLGRSYKDYLLETIPESGGRAVDLCAFFLRKAYGLVRSHGSVGILVTNSISEGDTKAAGLSQVCKENGTIYNAKTRIRWPGAATVIVSSVHIAKQWRPKQALLDERRVPGINSSMMPMVKEFEPKKLVQNNKKSFHGCFIYGAGFTFDDIDNTGLAGTTDEMKKLIEADPRNAELIHPYIGGSEINSSPDHSHSRFVINFGNKSYEEASSWPDLLELVRQRVKPERDTLGGYSVADRRREYWWQYGTYSPAYIESISGLNKYLAHSFTSTYVAFAFIPGGTILAGPHNAFPFDDYAHFSLFQSTLHSLWVKTCSSSMGDGIRYTTSECLDTFPFPDMSGTNARELLEESGKNYYEERAKIMIRRSIGMTELYNLFHDPACEDRDIDELRNLHQKIDLAVLSSFGWLDIDHRLGYTLDYIELSDIAAECDCTLDEGTSAEIIPYFETPAQAIEWASISKDLLKALPWRHEWSASIKREVISRLTILNADRYEEEVAQGLHSKSSKKASGPAAPGAKRRGRPPKSAQAGETDSVQAEQIGLAL